VQLNTAQPRARLASASRRLVIAICVAGAASSLQRTATAEAPSRPPEPLSDVVEPLVTTEHADTKPKDAPLKPAAKGAPEDTATERAALQMGAYKDNDAVTVFTPSVAIGIENASGASLRANYLIDIVSAASADIVSTASSRWQEVRHAGSLYGEYKPRDFGVGVGASVSREPDYLSYGAYATVRKDFSEKNWALYFGYGFSHDTAGRCGGANDGCTPFSVFSRTLWRTSFNGGVDLVVDRASLASITADVIVENGDQSKPYRYVPLFTPEMAPTVPKGAPIAFVNGHSTPERSLEQLPLSRRRFAVSGRYARRMGISTLRLMERLYADTWGLMATSTDARFIFDLGRRFALWPHARFHYQRQVNFWQRAYVSRNPGWDLPEYRTGDRELGPLWTVTGGLGFKWYLGRGVDLENWAVQLTADEMYTSFLDDLYLTSRIATVGAISVEGAF
jgi:hypothetical protein